MKALLWALLAFSFMLVSGCGNNSSVVTPMEGRNTFENDGPTDSYTLTLKVTQLTENGTHVRLDHTFTTPSPWIENWAQFTTLASRDGLSTFKIDYTVTWNGNAAFAAIWEVSPGYSLVYHLPTSSGSYSNTINNASLNESTTYSYTTGIVTFDDGYGAK